MPIAITDENREELKRRNNLLLDVVRVRANGITIDGVGDLPRIMRTPGTFNRKLGNDNAPLCHIVENTGLLFSPAELDEKLNSLISIQTQKNVTESKIDYSSSVYHKRFSTSLENYGDDRDFNTFRAQRMLDFINPSALTYDEWR